MMDHGTGCGRGDELQSGTQAQNIYKQKHIDADQHVNRTDQFKETYFIL